MEKYAPSKSAHIVSDSILLFIYVSNNRAHARQSLLEKKNNFFLGNRFSKHRDSYFLDCLMPVPVWVLVFVFRLKRKQFELSNRRIDVLSCENACGVKNFYYVYRYTVQNYIETNNDGILYLCRSKRM